MRRQSAAQPQTTGVVVWQHTEFGRRSVQAPHYRIVMGRSGRYELLYGEDWTVVAETDSVQDAMNLAERDHRTRRAA